jgi:hypothetical protein
MEKEQVEGEINLADKKNGRDKCDMGLLKV